MPLSGAAGAQPRVAVRTRSTGRIRRFRRTAVAVLGCFGCATPAIGENWRTSAFVSLTETYTDNANFSSRGQTSDFVTSLGAGFTVRGQGARVQLAGTVAASWQVYAREAQNNSLAPRVNLLGRVEAIENFFFVEGTANVSTSFLTPFGPQPANVVNATDNRYTQQTYSIAPYIQGVLGSTNVSYRIRDESIWTIASTFGGSPSQVPDTYANTLTATLHSGRGPVGWTVEYIRSYYENGLRDRDLGGSYTTQVARFIVPYRIDPQFQVTGRVGYERNEFPRTESDGVIYGAGVQWSPTERTQIGGYWEHRFFGSSFSWQLSHRMPSAALRATFSRGLNSYPQLALVVPAGVTVEQFLDAAFTTRLPDPEQRAEAVDEFLERTGLPPTLAAPVNFYGFSETLQNRQSITLVLIGVRNSLSITAFNVDSTAISGAGSALPPALQFGQDNTQTGVGLGYSHQVTGFTSLSASASYSRTTSDNEALSNARSNNGNFGLALSTRFTPKTTGTAGVTWSLFRPVGDADRPTTSAFNAFVGIRHTF